MAHLQMGQVVSKCEFGTPRIGAANYIQNAKQYLASQMFTDAVFNQDIRVIQQLINRIDGGLPKDVDIDNYQTLFGDCMNEVLNMVSSDQTKVLPEDTVMMALCKSLYDLASADIYYEKHITQEGKRKALKKKPSPEAKQTRETALRMILERAGGRRTMSEIRKETSKVDVADWIGELPEKQENS